MQVWFGQSTSNYNYILESRGEILWVSVKTREYDRYRMGPDPCLLSVKVSVQALEEPLLYESSALEKMRWVRRDGYSLGDRVLFLGLRHSFAVDAGCLPQ